MNKLVSTTARIVGAADPTPSAVALKGALAAVLYLALSKSPPRLIKNATENTRRTTAST